MIYEKPTENLPIPKPIKFIFLEEDFNKIIRPALIADANKVKCRDTSFHKQKLQRNYSAYHILNNSKKLKALLKEYGVDLFVRRFIKSKKYQSKFARWVNRKEIFKTVKWKL